MTGECRLASTITRKPARFAQLDALRGIAAVLVVLHHCYQTWPVYPQFVRFTPARLLLNGRSSVIFFFVLSGFVLAHALLSGQRRSYGVFVGRRLARIYLPYAAAGALAAVAALIFAGGAVPGAGVTFEDMWTQPPSLRAVIAHLGLVGDEEAIAINAPSWSLVYELRISMLIPPLVFALTVAPRTTVAAATGLVALAEAWLWRHGSPAVLYAASGVAETVAATLHFTACFFVGVLLARAAARRPEAPFAMPTPARVAMAFVAFALAMVFRDLTCTLGGALVIVLALNSPGFARWLEQPLLVWLGRISFSLYLTHMIVIEAVVRGLAGIVPVPAALGVAMLLVVPVAVAFFRLVERPCHGLARAVGAGRSRSVGLVRQEA